MTWKQKGYLYALLFTIFYVLYYFLVVWLSFSNVGEYFSPLMMMNFFLNQVIFVTFAVLLILRKTMLGKRTMYIIVSIVFMILIGIFILSYQGISIFPIIGSVLIYLGLAVSGSTIILIRQIRKDKLKKKL